jgi:cytochrome c oxidase subunit 2
MFSGAASTFGTQVDAAFWFILVACIAMLIPVIGLMIFFVCKYHRKKQVAPANIEGNFLLEFFWTGALTLIMLVMFWYGWIGYRTMANVPDGALQIKAEGRMWMWLFEYENGKKTDTLHLPVGKPVKLNLSSVDILHSLYVPAFRVKMDTVPGINNTVWFTPDEVGSYDLFCTEYCGFGHASMLSKVVVIPEWEFTAWLTGKTAKATK